MRLIITSLIINFCISIVFYIIGLDADISREAEVFGWFFYPVIAVWLTSVLGLILILSDKRKLGAALVMFGTIFFMPLGLIGFVGGARIMAEVQQETLSKLQPLSNPTKEPAVYYARHQIKAILIMVIAVFVLMVFAEFTMGINAPLGILSISIGALLFRYYTPALTLGDNYLKIALGTYRKHNLLFSEIKKYEQTDKKITFYYQLADSNKSGKTVLHLSAFEQDVKADVLKHLMPKLNSGPIATTELN